MNAIDAVRDREHILSIVSHDLKNPIFAIRLAIENLKKNAAKDDKEISEISQLVDNSISLMEKLIVDLLDFSKIEAGTFTVERTPCSPMEIARQASQILSLAVQEKKLQYNLEVNENLPEIICEKGRIIQVLSNLIGNAIKFSPPGGIVKLTVLEQKDFIVFSVSDNGPGIKEENLKFIFQQFWQSKETASLGTGLGLSIAKGIVDAHGGKIWAESIFGKGTTVSFTVPKLITEIKKIPQRQDQSLGLKDEFILLVDDSQDLRFLMRKLLEKYGAQVVDVSSVSEARNEMLKSISRPFDLIITDIDMPIESGFDLLKDVRRIYKGRKSSVIALTGFSDSEDIQNIMSAGFDLCFSKPVNMERLVSDIDILLHPKKNSELLL
jgi:CheY-like chemotaxis protein